MIHTTSEKLHLFTAISLETLARYDGETLITELNSAVGTLETEKKEERLEELIKQLEQDPEASGDYREWLKSRSIVTEGIRSMGSAEGTMSVFAKRMKNGRSWVEKGASAMMTAMVALMDKLPLKTLSGMCVCILQNVVL